MAHVHLRFHGDQAWLWMGTAVLAVLLVCVAGLFIFDSRVGGPFDPQSVRVTAVAWSLGGIPLTSGLGVGFRAGTSLTVTLAFTCNVCGTLLMTAAATNTSGFAVTSSNLPLTIPAGATGNISVTLSTPRLDYSGPLNINLS